AWGVRAYNHAMTSGQTSGHRAPGHVIAGLEVWIVLGLSLGQSGVYAVVNLIGKLTRGPLSEQTATLNESVTPREYLDLTYQLLGIGSALGPVARVLSLPHVWGDPPLRVLGIGRGRWAGDLGFGVGLAALIGIPGLGLYLLGRALDLNATVVPAALN